MVRSQRQPCAPILRHYNTAHNIFEHLDSNPWFYSVHSYYAEMGEDTIATSSYGLKYTSAVQKSNFFGTQFHPEKSSHNGKQLIQNFLKL